MSRNSCSKLLLLKDPVYCQEFLFLQEFLQDSCSNSNFLQIPAPTGIRKMHPSSHVHPEDDRTMTFAFGSFYRQEVERNVTVLE